MEIALYGKYHTIINNKFLMRKKISKYSKVLLNNGSYGISWGSFSDHANHEIQTVYLNLNT